MDNDNPFIRKIKKLYKTVKFKINYSDKTVLCKQDGNTEIFNVLSVNAPAMIARCGATEMRCIGEYLKGCFSEKIKREIQQLSGVFPVTDEFLRKFCEFYIECVGKSDILALWGAGAESKVVHRYCENSRFVELEALEPYYFDNPWSRILKGKKVLVIHPFRPSIMSQYENRIKLFTNQDVLPKFRKLTCIQAVQSLAGEKSEFVTWFEALEYMCKEIVKIDFDIAIIGAGAYGLPLASYVKSIGKKAVQLSGATQILFGIKGKRWDKHPLISLLYNDYWVRPLIEETPKEKQKVEGGSYW
jgi:hypothetical protein